MSERGLCLTLNDIINNKSEDLKDKVKTFLQEKEINKDEWIIGKLQEKAWIDCFEFLKSYSWRKDIENLKLIFEYSLPGTYHKRPDILILLKNELIILEFKTTSNKHNTNMQQLLEYSNFLKYDHEITKNYNLSIYPYIVYTNVDDHQYKNDCKVLTKNNFFKTLEKIITNSKQCDDEFLSKWLNSEAIPSPTLLKAIENSVKEGCQPYLKNYNKTCLDTVNKIIQEAEKNKEKHLIIISGVPGSGKTALGLNITFEHNKNGVANAVYFSGNRYLIDELKETIINKNNSSAHGVNYLIKNFYEIKNNSDINNNILIFDEAQRAWDSSKNQNKKSDPEILHEIGDKIAKKNGYSVIIALYGSGQAIYKNEEGGIQLWINEFKNSDWKLSISSEFSNNININTNSALYLSNSIRTNRDYWNNWVKYALNNNQFNFEEAKKIAVSLNIYITRNEKQKNKLVKKRFVLLSTEDGRNKNNEAKSHFECQGLEYDFTIVKFKGDFFIKNGRWVYRALNESHKYENEHDIINNRYHVLLTRARTRMILYIPNEKALDETYNYFIQLGAKALE